MKRQERCCVPLNSFGQTQCEAPCLKSESYLADIFHRTKAQLCSGELEVPGDQWPIFLYADAKYNPEDPWEGFLRNRLLIKVRQ